MPGTPSVGEKFVENFRESIIKDLFDGQESEIVDTDGDLSISLFLDNEAIQSLEGVDKDLEELEDHEIIRGILAQGHVMKEYSREVEEKLRQVEFESIQDYIQESGNMVELHDEIKQCGDILNDLEQLLGKYQGDLGRVGEEIRQLQVQSHAIGTKLRNRRSTESRMGTFIEELTLSEDFVNIILECDVNDRRFMEALVKLDQKILFVRNDPTAWDSQARRDLEPVLEKLRVRAVSKVRDVVLDRMMTLRRPKTNVQIVQQTLLARLKPYVRFIINHASDVYLEVRGEYISSKSRILSQHFTTYLQGMSRVAIEVAGQGDLLGAPDAGGFGSGGGGGGGGRGRGRGGRGGERKRKGRD
mmetsp:Transcript_21139/g.37752  ORF Transcript_21139/g.37752 Transcript_21139/m.37752 type:complete len:358 (-) Transcript_21139:140-1213(-)